MSYDISNLLHEMIATRRMYNMILVKDKKCFFPDEYKILPSKSTDDGESLGKG